jgi:hypothetical protein
MMYRLLMRTSKVALALPQGFALHHVIVNVFTTEIKAIST